MLLNSKALSHFDIIASDGLIGRLRSFYFDDVSWHIRFFTVHVNVPEGVKSEVLLSPVFTSQLNLHERSIHIRLNKDQIARSPLAGQESINPSHIKNYFEFVDLPSYWTGPEFWGPVTSPYHIPARIPQPEDAHDQSGADDSDLHLHSLNLLKELELTPMDGSSWGRVAGGVIIETDQWLIRYLLVRAQGKLRSQMLERDDIVSVDWQSGQLITHLNHVALDELPHYNSRDSVNRIKEDRIYDYRGHAL